MSGWIKLEKDLLTDPRVIKIGNALCNASAFHGVTVVLGALAHLWMIADTHIGNDDVIPIGVDDIDQVIGIGGFCQLLPSDWLQVIDAHSVKLPNFHAHNGTIAKERAQVSRRVAKHRARGNATPLHAVTPKRYQTETKTETLKENNQKKNGSRIPADFALTPERAAIAGQHGLDPQRTLADFRDFWTAAAGAKARKADWDATWRVWCRRSSDFKQASGNGRPAANHDAERAEAIAHAREIGFPREIYPKESVSAFRTEVKQWEQRPRSPQDRSKGLAQLLPQNAVKIARARGNGSS